MAESPGVKTNAKRRKVMTDYTKCIKCQKGRTSLQSGKLNSIKRFVAAAQKRQDDVYCRIQVDIVDGDLNSETVKWHKSCYSTYTSIRNIFYNPGASQETSETDETLSASSSSSLRSPESVTNWNLCLFCQQRRCKGEHILLLVSKERHQQVHETILNAANVRGDETIKRRLIGEDLVACEARYHAGCCKRFTSISNLKNKASAGISPSVHEVAFQHLIKMIDKKLLTEKRAFEMSCLIKMYRDLLIGNGLDEDGAEKYKMQNLKIRLERHYDNKILFYSQYHRNKSELVCSSDINIADLINHNADLNFSHSQMQEHLQNVSSQREIEANQYLYKTALLLREEMDSVEGITIKPLDVSDISLEKAKSIVPNTLQKLILLLTVPQNQFEVEGALSEVTPQDEDQERNCLSISQDIIHCSSSGTQKMLEHIGLALAI